MASDLTSTYNRDDDAEKLILVDCNGTLFIPETRDNLFDFLDAARASGEFRVVVFSDDFEGNKNSLMLAGMKRHRDAGFYGEIARKQDYDGRKAFLVVDDDHSTHKVDARFKLDPRDAKAIAKMHFWLTSGADVVAQSIRDAAAGVPPGVRLN